MMSSLKPLEFQQDLRISPAGIPAGLIRISCGLEDKKDLIADIAQALEAI